ncbi:hypothetical protein D3C80_1804420 [compost metagenome]
MILTAQVRLGGKPAAIPLGQQLEQQHRRLVAQVGEADPPLAALPPEAVVHGEHPAMGRGVAPLLRKEPATLMIGHPHLSLATAVPVGRGTRPVARLEGKSADLWQLLP